MMGMSAERSLGKPGRWDGDDKGFEDFRLSMINWLNGLPGTNSNTVEFLLKSASDSPNELHDVDYTDSV